jgi:hypothetical protein
LAKALLCVYQARQVGAAAPRLRASGSRAAGVFPFRKFLVAPKGASWTVRDPRARRQQAGNFNG